ncbi:MAG TPA: response regulator [Patescibacteria group bacterium]|nr:response regulator [Patescibacteria group bacterium]
MAKPYVLVVDDNRITTKLLRRYLDAHGFEAGEAYDGIECLEKVVQRTPDAIVLDVMMPRLDGYETVKRLRENPETSGIPVVIVTALNDVANQVKAIESGADDFLSKPIEEKLLVAKVRLLSNISVANNKVKALTGILEKVANTTLSPDQIGELLQQAISSEPTA